MDAVAGRDSGLSADGAAGAGAGHRFPIHVGAGTVIARAWQTAIPAPATALILEGYRSTAAAAMQESFARRPERLCSRRLWTASVRCRR